MHPSDIVAEINYYLNTETPDQIPFPFPFPFPQDNLSLLHSNLQQANQKVAFTPIPLTSSPLNSTSDESEEQQVKIMIDERRQRRMISNRESARRSRMRKQRHLDELWSQVIRLRNENHKLIDKLNQVSESYDRVVQENTRLKEEASDLRQMMSTMQLASPFSGFPDLDDDDIAFTATHPKAESSNQSVTSSSDLLL